MKRYKGDDTMNTKRFLILMAAVALVLLVGGSVYADDGRMNPAPFHFGGDSLFCNAGSGCTLVNQTDQTLATWKQSEVDAALSLTDSTGANAQVGKDGQGTFGVAQLWSVKADASLGKRQLCLVGYDEWGKQNSMCFFVSKTSEYEAKSVPVAQADSTMCSSYVGSGEPSGDPFNSQIGPGWNIYDKANHQFVDFVTSNPHLPSC